MQYQEEVQTLRRENAELREAQGQGSAYEAELEAQLQEKDSKANHLKEELSRLHRLSHVCPTTALRLLDEIRFNRAVVHADVRTKCIICI